jgi:Mpv17 / PMP22 family
LGSSSQHGSFGPLSIALRTGKNPISSYNMKESGGSSVSFSASLAHVNPMLVVNPSLSLIPAQHRILWVNSVDLVWNAILATLAQKKDSVFEELEGEDATENSNLSAFGTPTPIPSSAMATSSVTLKAFTLVNDTLSAMDIDVLLPSAQNDVVGSQTNSTTAEAMAV